MFVALAALLICWTGVSAISPEGLECPPGLYPYRCGSCISLPPPSPPSPPSPFTLAREACGRVNGALLTVESEQELEIVRRYLTALNEARLLWIGYRYSPSGVRVTSASNQTAPDVLQNDANFPANSEGGGGGSPAASGSTCIAVGQEGFTDVPCSTVLPFICLHSVVAAPVAKMTPDNEILFISESGSVTLTAEVHGIGITGMEWVQDGTRIRYETVPNQLSHVTSFTRDQFLSSSHSGAYELLVEFSSSAAARVTAARWQLREPVFDPESIQPSDLEVNLGGIAFFECQPETVGPRPEVTWFRDSAPLDVSGGRFLVSNVTGTLFIREVQASDYGSYHCVAGGSAVSRTATLSQLTLSQLQGVDIPSIILPPRNHSVLEGGTDSFECVGRSFAQPSTTVLFDDLLIDGGVRLHSYAYPSDDGFPVFYFTNTSRAAHHSLCFVCGYQPVTGTFRNVLFMSNKSFIEIHAVAAVSRLSTGISGLQSDSSSQSVPLGTTMTLECEFDGVPIPNTVEWTLNGAPITTGVSTDGNVSILSIPNFQTPGVYQCRVSNIYGSASESVVLYAGLDCPVSGAGPNLVPFKAVSDTNTSIYVAWNETTAGHTHPLLLQYEVVLTNPPPPQTAATPPLTFGPFPSSQRGLVINDLRPLTEYRCYVVANSPIEGVGEIPSIPTTVSTFPNAPTGSTNLTVHRSAGNTTLTVCWDAYLPTPPTEVHSYEVELGGGEGGEGVVTVIVFSVGGNVTKLERSGLVSTFTYTVRIRVAVQTQRSPFRFSAGPWSEMVSVPGGVAPPVATPPGGGFSSIPPTVVGGGGGLSTRATQGVLLVSVLAPLGTLIVVVVIVSVVISTVCWKKRKSKSAAKIEQRGPQRGPQRAMGTDVFKHVSDNMESHHEVIVNGNQAWRSNGTLNASCGNLSSPNATTTPPSTATTQVYLATDSPDGRDSTSTEQYNSTTNTVIVSADITTCPANVYAVNTPGRDSVDLSGSGNSGYGTGSTLANLSLVNKSMEGSTELLSGVVGATYTNAMAEEGEEKVDLTTTTTAETEFTASTKDSEEGGVTTFTNVYGTYHVSGKETEDAARFVPRSRYDNGVIYDQPRITRPLLQKSHSLYQQPDTIVPFPASHHSSNPYGAEYHHPQSSRLPSIYKSLDTIQSGGTFSTSLDSIDTPFSLHDEEEEDPLALAIAALEQDASSSSSPNAKRHSRYNSLSVLPSRSTGTATSHVSQSSDQLASQSFQQPSSLLKSNSVSHEEDYTFVTKLQDSSHQTTEPSSSGSRSSSSNGHSSSSHHFTQHRDTVPQNSNHGFSDHSSTTNHVTTAMAPTTYKQRPTLPSSSVELPSDADQPASTTSSPREKLTLAPVHYNPTFSLHTIETSTPRVPPDGTAAYQMPPPVGDDKFDFVHRGYSTFKDNS